MDILLLLLAIGLTAGALIGFHGYAKTQWLLVRPRPQGATGWVAGQGGRVSTYLDETAWAEAYHDLLDRAERNLGQDGGTGGAEAAQSLRELTGIQSTLAARTRDAVLRAIETGELQSMLVEKDGLVLSTVVVPGRHEHPKLLRRHEPFRDGWRAYDAGLRAAVARVGRPSKVLGLLFFFNPDARDGALVLSYHSETTNLSPAYLAEEAGARGATYPELFEFRLR